MSVVGTEVVRSGRVRVMVRRTSVLEGRESIVEWQWGIVSRAGAVVLDGMLGV